MRMSKIIGQMQAKRECYNRAQEVATALSLCYNKQELQETLEELGFHRHKLVSGTPRIEVERGEWQCDDTEHGKAIYISPFYEAVQVVDYTQAYVSSTVLLTENASRLLLELEYEGGSNIKVKGE